MPSDEPVNNSRSGSLAAIHSTAKPCPLYTTILVSLCNVHALAMLSAEPANCDYQNKIITVILPVMRRALCCADENRVVVDSFLSIFDRDFRLSGRRS